MSIIDPTNVAMAMAVTGSNAFVVISGSNDRKAAIDFPASLSL